ncbi:MAG TPA: hypothetical protein VJ798_02885 [Rhizomicrobium sp.]|nr:hypothetical protein [Rhizomicrobium sp.]
MQPSIPMKYRRPSTDWEKLPFQANGAGIAIYTSVLATLVSTSALKAGQFAIVPCVIYLLGLIAAYRVHISNMTLMSDVEMRERLNDAMEWLSEAERRDLPQELKGQASAIPVMVEEQRKSLLTAAAIQQHQLRAKNAYALSLRLFLMGTLVVMSYFWLFLISHP